MPRRIALALCLPLLLAGVSLAAPPTDDQIESFIKTVTQAKAADSDGDAAAKRQADRDAKRAAAAEGLKSLDIKDASLAQLQKLIDKRTATASPDVAEAVDARLSVLAHESTLDGAKAAELRLLVVPAPEKPTAEAMKTRTARIADLADEALKHPAAKDLFSSGGGENILRAIAAIPTGDSSGARELLKKHHFAESITPHITPNLSPSIVASLSRLVRPLVDAKDDIGAANYESFRTRLAAAAVGALPKAEKDRDDAAAKAKAAKPTDPDDKDAATKYKLAENAAGAADGMVKRLRDTSAMLNGPWARGELLDHAAPTVAFNWTSGDKPLHSFADLKGKVVLIDFWATWCGPCRAAFPKLRSLQERYAGYPVVILGVTSIQGSHSDVKAKKTIDCKGDPAKEMALMKDFMRDMEMTWTVAFSEQNVFNPDFGVSGIPHVAIIDPAGKVRFNNLYPNAKEESEHIDALLTEAKLPHPETPYVEPKKEEKRDDDKKG
jgi:thiol-disulfide isomerase/thioredoxin